MSLDVRRATSDDIPSILALATRTLGWADDDLHRSFFEWKHRASPFGPSPMWVATDGGDVVGFRTFLPWRFVGPDGERLSAVRAVDTATDPAHQGRGIFRTLTMSALEDLATDGVDFVFNTPNDKSRPGYLKMGWQVVGRVPIVMRPRSIAAAARLARARVPAALWSEDTGGTMPAFTNQEPRPTYGAMTTERSTDFLRWRYGFEPLHYQSIDTSDGQLIYRVRRRGPALEATICDVLGAPSGRLGRLLGEADADVAVATAATPIGGRGIPLPNQGPILTYRRVNRSDCPPLERWHLTMGDLELF